MASIVTMLAHCKGGPVASSEAKLQIIAKIGLISALNVQCLEHKLISPNRYTSVNKERRKPEGMVTQKLVCDSD